MAEHCLLPAKSHGAQEVLDRVEAALPKDLAHAPITALQEELSKGASWRPQP
jgi:hypothetical protein